MPPSAHTVAAVTAAAALAALFFFRRRARGVPSRTQALPSAVPRVAADAAEIAAAVRAEGVCLVKGVFDAAAVEALRSRIMAIEPKKMQNRRKHRWEHVHSPEDEVFASLAIQNLQGAQLYGHPGNAGAVDLGALETVSGTVSACGASGR